MRIAFFLSNPSPRTGLFIDLFDAANISGSGIPQQIARIEYEKTKNGWLLIGTRLPGLVSQIEKNLISKIARANTEALSTYGHLSPLTFTRALVSRRAVQLALDAQSKKFRCVSTMKEGNNLYEAAGTTITFEASDEESAIKIAKREVASEMAENPENAAKLVAFFSGGCKVKQIASGAVPDYMKIEELAATPAEEKLAKTPVKLYQKDDDKDE